MIQTKRPLAVVTGASSGIGLELAKILAENNFDLLVCAENAEIASAADQIRAAGAYVEFLQVDLSRAEGVTEFYSMIQKQNRPVSALALNAGVGTNGDFTRDIPLGDQLTLVDLNVRSVVHLAKLVLEDMVTQKSGRVLFTSSIAAMMPGSYEAVYNGSKAFVQSFAQALREELKDTGITVTALQPGPTETQFFKRGGFEGSRVAEMEKDDAREVAQQGFDAMMAGKDHVVAGSFMNKVMSTVGKIIPEKLGAALHTELSKPGTGNH